MKISNSHNCFYNQNFKGVDINLAKNTVKHPIKFLFTDIDGTILNNGILSNSHLDSIKKLIDSGVKLIITTGRGYKTIDTLFARFNMQPDYAITEGGATVVDKDKHILFTNPLSIENVKKIINISKKFLGENKFFRLTFNGFPYSEDKAAIEADKKGKVLYAKSFYEMLESGLRPTKAVFADYNSKSFEDIDRTKELLKNDLAPCSDLNIINSEYFYCEIMNRSVSKGNAIKALKDKLNFEYENIASIGDAENDLSMTELLTNNGGMSVSMGNGTDKMLDVSRFITSTVDNFGFTKAVDTIIEINKHFQ